MSCLCSESIPDLSLVPAYHGQVYKTGICIQTEFGDKCCDQAAGCRIVGFFRNRIDINDGYGWTTQGCVDCPPTTTTKEPVTTTKSPVVTTSNPSIGYSCIRDVPKWIYFHCQSLPTTTLKRSNSCRSWTLTYNGNTVEFTLEYGEGADGSFQTFDQLNASTQWIFNGSSLNYTDAASGSSITSIDISSILSKQGKPSDYLGPSSGMGGTLTVVSDVAGDCPEKTTTTTTIKPTTTTTILFVPTTTTTIDPNQPPNPEETTTTTTILFVPTTTTTTAQNQPPNQEEDGTTTTTSTTSQPTTSTTTTTIVPTTSTTLEPITTTTTLVPVTSTTTTTIQPITTTSTTLQPTTSTTIAPTTSTTTLEPVTTTTIEPFITTTTLELVTSTTTEYPTTTTTTTQEPVTSTTYYPTTTTTIEPTTSTTTEYPTTTTVEPTTSTTLEPTTSTTSGPTTTIEPQTTPPLLSTTTESPVYTSPPPQQTTTLSPQQSTTTTPSPCQEGYVFDVEYTLSQDGQTGCYTCIAGGIVCSVFEGYSEQICLAAMNSANENAGPPCVTTTEGPVYTSPPPLVTSTESPVTTTEELITSPMPSTTLPN